MIASLLSTSHSNAEFLIFCFRERPDKLDSEQKNRLDYCPKELYPMDLVHPRLNTYLILILNNIAQYSQFRISIGRAVVNVIIQTLQV